MKTSLLSLCLLFSTLMLWLVPGTAQAAFAVSDSSANTEWVAVFEAEDLTLPAGSSIISDASASSGRAIKMARNGTATGAISFKTNVDSLAVTAKADKCKGGYPRLAVSVSGKTVLPATNNLHQ